MLNILIVYSTKDGQTLKICQQLQYRLKSDAHQVTVVSIKEADQVDLNGFDKIVIGASIHYGRHDSEIYAFIERNRLMLDSKSNAFFSVNLVARKREKSLPETNPYLQKFLKQIRWKPKHLAVFAGKIDYPSYTMFDRTLIRFIMWMTQGPTDPSACIEFTDWDQVEAFAHCIAQM